MASLQNFRHHKRQPSFWEGLGSKVRNVAEVVGTAKGLYDAGKFIYSAAQAAMPYVAPAAAFLA